MFNVIGLVFHYSATITIIIFETRNWKCILNGLKMNDGSVLDKFSLMKVVTLLLGEFHEGTDVWTTPVTRHYIVKGLDQIWDESRESRRDIYEDFSLLDHKYADFQDFFADRWINLTDDSPVFIFRFRR